MSVDLGAVSEDVVISKEVEWLVYLCQSFPVVHVVDILFVSKR